MISFTVWCCKILIGPLIPVWPGNKAAYYEAVPSRASRLRLSVPTVTHMRTRAIRHKQRPACPAHIVLSIKQSASALYSDTTSGIQSPFPSKTDLPHKALPPTWIIIPKTNTIVLCSLPPPSLLYARLHYSPLIVKSFCSIATRLLCEHILFMYSLRISHIGLFGREILLKLAMVIVILIWLNVENSWPHV